MKARRILLCVVGTLLFCTLPVSAAVYYGDCVTVNPMNQGWNLPADGAEHPLISNTITVESVSDVILTAAITVERTSTPGTRVFYVWEVDGLQRAPFLMRRVPQQLPNSQVFQTVVPSVTAGDHTFRLLAKHLESGLQLVRYGGMIMTPLFVDAIGNETVFVDSDPTENVSFGASWTTIKSLNISIAADDMVAIGASFRISSGTSGSPLEYRFLVGGVEQYTWSEDTPNPVPDGVHLSRFVRDAAVGMQSVEIQARSMAGATTQARNRYLFAQTMPEYHLYEVSSSDTSVVAADGDYHTLAVSPFSLISEISRGDQVGSAYKSFTGGAAYIEVPNQTARTHHFRLQMVPEGAPLLPFDIGQRLGRSSPAMDSFEPNLSGGCGGCAWEGETRHRVELWAQSTCASPGATMAFGKTTLQVAMLPSHWFFPDGSCGYWGKCCESAPNCTYLCSAADLDLVQIGPLACP